MECAHRGASLNVTENSIESFEKAYELGFKNFELDVHASADGQVFVFHDDNLRRLTGRNVQLNRLSAYEVKNLDIGGDKKIPTLSEVFEKFTDVQFNIDAKSWYVVTPLCKIIEKAQAHERICIGGFNDFRTLKIVKRLGPNVCYSIGPLGVLWFCLLRLLNVRWNFNAGCMQVPQRFLGFRLVSASFVSFAHECGLRVHVWTINEEEEMKRLIDIGVDGIMTDDCLGLKKVLQERQIWTG